MKLKIEGSQQVFASYSIGDIVDFLDTRGIVRSIEPFLGKSASASIFLVELPDGTWRSLIYKEKTN